MLKGFGNPGLEFRSAPPLLALAPCSPALGASCPSRCRASNYIPVHLFIVCLFPEFHQGRGHIFPSQLISWPKTVPGALKKKKIVFQQTFP